MAKRTWILTDLEQDIYVDQLALTPGHVPGAAAGFSVIKRALRGGRRDGVDVIEVNNGTFRFVLIPTRGMGLWRASLGDLSLGWHSPVKGPVNPQYVRLDAASGIGWLDGYDEMLVRCGLESNGAPEFNANGTLRYPLHGRIANCPAHRVEVTIDGDSGLISVTGVVDEARLFGSKLRLTSTVTTRPGQPGCEVVDTVTNLSAEPGELELLYHINFGPPLAAPGSTVRLPVRKVAPRDAVAVANMDQWAVYGPETPGLGEVVFFFDLAADADGQTQAVLCNPDGDRGVGLKFNKTQLPCFSLWKNRQAAADGYVTGLEPATNFPNVRSFEKQQGRVLTLAPGESRHFELTLEAYGDVAAVAAAQHAVAALQAAVEPQISRQHDPAWSRG